MQKLNMHWDYAKRCRCRRRLLSHRVGLVLHPHHATSEPQRRHGLFQVLRFPPDAREEKGVAVTAQRVLGKTTPEERDL